MSATDTITKTIFINAPREIVWEFLTKKDKLALWFHPAESDLALDSDYALVEAGADGKKLCWGRVLEMQPHTHMLWSFTVQPLQGAMTTVQWTLDEVSSGTRVTLVHSGVGKAAGEAAMGLLMALDKGWDEHFSALRQQPI
jgi:uncharacterized protein YndB with AHSA1/START domain